MHFTKWSVLGVLAIGFSLGSSEAEATGISHGSSCAPLNATHGANIAYDEWGLRNTSTTASRSIICSGDVSSEPRGNAIIMMGWDQHTTQDITCVYRMVDAWGNTQWSQGVSTSGTGSKQVLATVPSAFTSYIPVMTCTLPPAIGGASYVSSVYMP